MTTSHDEHHDAAGERRARVRDAAVREIKQAAREHLLRYGPGELSLRAVARDVGVTPSALYRYFDSRGALVSALSADALESATEALETAADEEQQPCERLRAMFEALRSWSLSHRSEFELIFANRDEQTRPDPAQSAEMRRLIALPLGAAMAAFADGSLEPSPTSPPLNPEAASTAPDWVEPALLAQAMLVCTRCVGWLYLEHFGMVGWAVADADVAYKAHLDAILGPPPAER